MSKVLWKTVKTDVPKEMIDISKSGTVKTDVPKEMIDISKSGKVITKKTLMYIKFQNQIKNIQ